MDVRGCVSDWPSGWGVRIRMEGGNSRLAYACRDDATTRLRRPNLRDCSLSCRGEVRSAAWTTTIHGSSTGRFSAPPSYWGSGTTAPTAAISRRGAFQAKVPIPAHSSRFLSSPGIPKRPMRRTPPGHTHPLTSYASHENTICSRRPRSEVSPLLQTTFSLTVSRDRQQSNQTEIATSGCSGLRASRRRSIARC